MKYVFKRRFCILIIFIFDIFGIVLFFPFRLFKKPAPLNPKKILVIRLDHIGDFVCTTPLLKNIRKRFPDAKITVIVNSVSKELAYRDPHIDNVITFSPHHLARGDKSDLIKGLARIIKDVRDADFDLGIEPRGDILSILIMYLGNVGYRVGYGITGGSFLLHKEGRYDKNIHVIDRNLLLLKELTVPIEYRSADIYFNDRDIAFVDDVMKDINIEGKDKAITLHPFTGAEARKWSKDSFQDLIDRLKSNGISVFLVGTNNDTENYTNVTDVRGKFNLPQLAYFIKRTNYFIGLNSGPANIAAALGVPSVVISSGTNIIEHWIPHNSSVKFVYKNVNCKPCELKTCPRPTHECMDSITAEEVFEKFKEIAG